MRYSCHKSPNVHAAHACIEGYNWESIDLHCFDISFDSNSPNGTKISRTYTVSRTISFCHFTAVVCLFGTGVGLKHIVISISSLGSEVSDERPMG